MAYIIDNSSESITVTPPVGNAEDNNNTYNAILSKPNCQPTLSTPPPQIDLNREPLSPLHETIDGSIYDIIFPTSSSSLSCLTNLGETFEDTEWWEMLERHFFTNLSNPDMLQNVAEHTSDGYYVYTVSDPEPVSRSSSPILSLEPPLPPVVISYKSELSENSELASQPSFPASPTLSYDSDHPVKDLELVSPTDLSSALLSNDFYDPVEDPELVSQPSSVPTSPMDHSPVEEPNMVSRSSFPTFQRDLWLPPSLLSYDRELRSQPSRSTLQKDHRLISDCVFPVEDLESVVFIV